MKIQLSIEDANCIYTRIDDNGNSTITRTYSSITTKDIVPTELLPTMKYNHDFFIRTCAWLKEFNMFYKVDGSIK